MNKKIFSGFFCNITKKKKKTLGSNGFFAGFNEQIFAFFGPVLLVRKKLLSPPATKKFFLNSRLPSLKPSKKWDAKKSGVAFFAKTRDQTF